MRMVGKMVVFLGGFNGGLPTEKIIQSRWGYQNVLSHSNRREDNSHDYLR